MTIRRIPRKAVDDLLLKCKRRCAFCYMQGDTTPKVGDIAHIKPIKSGGTDSFDNLIFLCSQHHREIYQAEDSAPALEAIKEARDRLYEAVSKETESSQAKGPKVFVVYGYNDSTRNELKQYLGDHGLEPIMLDEQPSFGMTILEKIESNANADYAISVLGREAPDSSARQNQIFELGYFLGRLGRKRVCVLVMPGVQLPSDIHGMLYVIKDNHGRWKDVLTRELIDAGVRLRPKLISQKRKLVRKSK